MRNLRIVSLPAKIWTKHLQNRSEKYYWLSQFVYVTEYSYAGMFFQMIIGLMGVFGLCDFIDRTTVFIFILYYKTISSCTFPGLLCCFIHYLIQKLPLVRLGNSYNGGPECTSKQPNQTINLNPKTNNFWGHYNIMKQAYSWQRCSNNNLHIWHNLNLLI
jgi:hypothetical protein